MINCKQVVKDIKEAHKLIEKNYDLISDSRLRQSYKEEMLTYEGAYSCDLFENAHYLFYEKRLIKGQLVGTRYHYYDVKTGEFVEEFTNSKRPVSKIGDDITNTALSNRVVINAITGLKMNHINPGFRKTLEWKGSIELPEAQSSYMYLNGQIIQICTSYGRGIYSNTTELYLNGKRICSSEFSDLMHSYLDEKFKKEEAYPEGLKFISMSGVAERYSDSSFLIGYDKKTDKFYIRPHRKYCYGVDTYSIPAKEHNGLKYIDIDTDFFYIDNDSIMYASLNREYSNTVKNMYVILDEDFNIKFSDRPYSKFIKKIQEYIVYENRVIECDSIMVEVELSGGREYISKSNIDIVECINEEDEVIPVNVNANNNTIKRTVFLIANDNGFSVYINTAQDHANVNILTLPNYIRFGRKKSDIFVHENYICKSDGNGDYSIVDASNFDLTTLKTTSLTEYKIKGKDGYDYISTKKGLFRLEVPYGEYDSIEAASNIVLTLKGISYVNGSKVWQSNSNTVLISKDGHENIVLENTVIRIDERGNKYLYTAYPSDELRGCENAFKFYLNGYNYNMIIKNATIMHENENIVIYTISRSEFEGEKPTTFVYSKITGDCILSSKVTISCHNFFGLEEVYQGKAIELPIPSYLYVCGYIVRYDKLDSFSKQRDTILKLVLEDLNNNNICVNSKEEAIAAIDNSIYNTLTDLANKYGVNVTKDDIINCKSVKNLKLILSSMKNLESGVRNSKFIEIFGEIEKAIKGKETLNSELFNNCNRVNETSFMNLGLSLDKFNSFNKVIEFQASSGDSSGIKESLSNDIFTQFEIHLGSRARSLRGFLQLDSIESFEKLYLRYIGENLNIDKMLLDSNGEAIDSKQVVKEINKLGFKFFGIIKKYNISIDLVNNNLLIDNRSCTTCKFKKIAAIAKDMISLTEKLKNSIENNNKFNEDSREIIKKVLSWSISHIEEAVGNIDEDVEANADKTEAIKIQLWDRYDILEALTQGNKTHCCLAMNSFNIHHLVKYIYNKNINLVEIRNKDGVIGQAFVSIYRTKNKFHYRYEYKQHLFMIIDNVEVNNSYAMYQDDIARNLQKFMNMYMLYTSDKISDVFLGTSMNDIRPPYNFTQDIDVEIIGEKELYLDHSSTFYKFI